MQTIHPTEKQVTYIWRTLQHVNCDYEKVTELAREVAAQLIHDIKQTFERHALKSNTRYTEEEKQSALNGRIKDLRALVTFYKI